MTTVTPLDGIASQMIQTSRLNTHVLTGGPDDGVPVVFLHGNFSAATYWEETMLALPTGFRGIAPDLRGYGWSEDKLVDATRGMRDWVDDLDALFDTMSIERAHLVGWSLGGGVVFRFITDHPDKVLSATLVAPVSPYGFGGTRDASGTSCHADFAGSGGGTVNPEFVKRIIAGDRGTDDPNSPRNVINAFYYKAPFRAAREEDFLTAALAEKMGDQRYPGDMTPSENWPNVAPGVCGPINAGSPKYVAGDAEALIAVQPKPPILWIHGSDDLIVGDLSFFDFGALAKLGFVPGGPGEEIYPPQPMVGQTRAVLDAYAANGGQYRELVMQDTAHSPHIEKPAEFSAAFHGLLRDAS